MKQPKKPTRDQKKMLVKEGMDPKEWMVQSEDNISVLFISKAGSERKLVLK